MPNRVRTRPPSHARSRAGDADDPGPGDWLPDALATAVDRRAATGWDATEPARRALQVAVAEPLPARERDQLATIAGGFGLSTRESRLLEVAAAAQRSVPLHLLLGLLGGDEGPGRPTVALALELAGLPVTDAAAYRALGPLTSLVRFGLLRPAGDEVLLARRLVLPDRVAAHLAGHELPDPSLVALLDDAVPVPTGGTEPIAAALSAGHRLVCAYGPVGSAAAAAAVAACRTLGVTCLVADLHRLPPGADVAAAVSALELEAGLAGSVLVVRGAARARPEHFEHAAVPVVAVSSEPWEPAGPAGPVPSVPVGRLSRDERAALWRPMLGDLADDPEISTLRLSPEQIVAVAAHARAMAALRGEPQLGRDEIRAAVRRIGRGRGLGGPGPDGGPAASLDDLILPEHALGEIRRLLDWARYRDEVAARGRLYGVGGKGNGISALFAGPPGTGKTLAAHVVADALAMDLYQVELPAVIDKYIGETEKNLEKVFEDAESTGALLFFDEADALFGSRSEVRDARDRYANQEIAYLLQRMEHFDGITVLASNLRGNMDAAFARRLQFIVSFPEPDEATRARLWRHYLGRLDDLDPADPVDVAQLARTVELSGGDIRNIVLSAVYAAVAAAEPLGMRHVRPAVRREFIKLGKRVPAAHVDADHTPVGSSRPGITAEHADRHQ